MPIFSQDLNHKESFVHLQKLKESVASTYHLVKPVSQAISFFLIYHLGRVEETD